MDKFEYKGKAEIRHLNVRKEGPEDEKALAVDIKVQCVTDSDMLEFFHEGLKASLFTDAGAVKNQMLKPLEFSNSILNCDLAILEQRYFGVDASKFSLKPKDGNQVVMTFSVSIQPNGDDVAKLAEFVMDEVDIHIQPQPTLDFGGEQSAAPANNDSDVEDEMYDKAVAVVMSNRRASISLVQRDLRIGYNRAARLMEAMEAKGIVSPMQSNGHRDVVVTA